MFLFNTDWIVIVILFTFRLRAGMWLCLTVFRTILTASPSSLGTSFSWRARMPRDAGEYAACQHGTHDGKWSGISLFSEGQLAISANEQVNKNKLRRSCTVSWWVFFFSRLVKNLSGRQEGSIPAARLPLIRRHSSWMRPIRPGGKKERCHNQPDSLFFELFLLNFCVLRRRDKEPEIQNAQLPVEKKGQSVNGMFSCGCWTRWRNRLNWSRRLNLQLWGRSTKTQELMTLTFNSRSFYSSSWSILTFYDAFCTVETIHGCGPPLKPLHPS